MSKISTESIALDNSNKPIMAVYHHRLAKSGEDSEYWCMCPATGCSGILLGARDTKTGQLQRADRCVLCGQFVYYLDEGINGELLSPFSFADLFQAYMGDAWVVARNYDSTEWGLQKANANKNLYRDTKGKDMSIAAVLTDDLPYTEARELFMAIQERMNRLGPDALGKAYMTISESGYPEATIHRDGPRGGDYIELEVAGLMSDDVIALVDLSHDTWSIEQPSSNTLVVRVKTSKPSSTIPPPPLAELPEWIRDLKLKLIALYDTKKLKLLIVDHLANGDCMINISGRKDMCIHCSSESPKFGLTLDNETGTVTDKSFTGGFDCVLKSVEEVMKTVEEIL